MTELPWHPIRFGVHTVGLDTLDEWTALATDAEALGYSSLLVSDHVVDFLPVGGASPLMALAAAAAVTSRIALGTIVLCNDFRHPIVLAKDAATLDLMSNGRIELGIGAGWHRPDYEALGLPFDGAGVRIGRLVESLEIMKACWSGRPVDFEGQYYSVRGYVGHPATVRAGGPRLMVGGGSPRILRSAGRYADIVGVHVSTVAADWVLDTSFERVTEKIGWIREGAGDRFDDIELQMSCTVRITDGTPGAARRVAEELGISLRELENAAMLIVGDLDQIADGVRRRQSELGVTYFLVAAERARELAPVVTALTTIEVGPARNPLTTDR